MRGKGCVCQNLVRMKRGLADVDKNPISEVSRNPGFRYGVGIQGLIVQSRLSQGDGGQRAEPRTVSVHSPGRGSREATEREGTPASPGRECM